MLCLLPRYTTEVVLIRETPSCCQPRCHLFLLLCRDQALIMTLALLGRLVRAQCWVLVSFRDLASPHFSFPTAPARCPVPRMPSIRGPQPTLQGPSQPVGLNHAQQHPHYYYPTEWHIQILPGRFCPVQKETGLQSLDCLPYKNPEPSQPASDPVA